LWKGEGIREKDGRSGTKTLKGFCLEQGSFSEAPLPGFGLTCIAEKSIFDIPELCRMLSYFIHHPWCLASERPLVSSSD
jgi:hypothetical protein